MTQNKRSKKSLRMRVASGSVNSNNKLVAFLYLLIRDHLPSGIVEEIALNIDNTSFDFTNGWLAEHAKDLAKRLK